MMLNMKEDLHIHCNYNDHSSIDLTIPNIINKSESIGLERIAITEHVRKNSEWTKKYIDEIDSYIPRTNVKILKGFEAKILVDGEIDCPNEYLNKDYFIIASFHTRYNKEVWYESLVLMVISYQDTYKAVLTGVTSDGMTTLIKVSLVLRRGKRKRMP